MCCQNQKYRNGGIQDYKITEIRVKFGRSYAIKELLLFHFSVLSTLLVYHIHLTWHTFWVDLGQIWLDCGRSPAIKGRFYFILTFYLFHVRYPINR